MTDHTGLSTIGKRYVLHEQLGGGGMGAVYRATDRLAGQTVAFKRVTVPASQLTFASRAGDTNLALALAQEFKTLASLRHPNIISVLDYGFDEERQPFFTMNLLENARTVVDAGQGQDLETQVDLIVQVLQALVYLHRRNILHRDLKPGNVLVTPEDGQVKLLDFGVSVTTSRTMEYLTQTTAGTLTYLAPELFTGAPVTKASDLYAVGVMAYELFAGRFPYNNANMAVLMYDILSTPPDVWTIGVGDDLAGVLERLLVKTREERYADAGEVIRHLCAATGCPLPPETVEIRESFLQAAKFVGRDAELEQLSDVLRRTMEGRGSAWLIGGESGVGKSRLADELRTLALVEGALALRGQAISEGGSPYHLWRDVLRWLALTANLEPDEAGELKPLVPDIGDLMGYDVPDSPPLDPQATQTRLLQVVEGAFGRQEQPVVVILEDLQWIRSDSLALLDQLAQGAANLPLLIVGNYRDDERPHLSDELPAMQVLRLERLDERGIADLSALMLGQAGRREQVIGLLRRETEGNPFFLVETVRALAEEIGQLDLIGAMTLPERVFAGGVQELVQRRLSRVPDDARPLLRLAAVAGRELDLHLLVALAPGVDLNGWLTACADVAVLDVEGESWRFSHDKLRGGVLGELSDDVRPGLHRQVAEAIEVVYPGAPEQVATLAHLWSVSGDWDKERCYCRLAGEQAMRNNANVEAIGYLEKALELLETTPDTLERAQEELALQLGRGNALIMVKGFGSPEVGQAYTRARELCQHADAREAPQLFPALWGLWANYLVRAEHQVARELGEQLLHLAQRAQDRNLLLQAHHALWTSFLFLGEFTSAHVHVDQGLAVYDPQQHHSHTFLYGGHDPGVCCLTFAGAVLWCLGYPEQALQRSNEAVALAQELSHPVSLALALRFLAALYQFRREEQAVQERAGAAIALATEHGSPLWAGWADSLQGWALARQGRGEVGIAQIRRGLATFQATGAAHDMPYQLALLAEAYETVGQIEEGLNAVDEALAAAHVAGGCYYEAELYRLKGELLLTRGKGVAAVEAEACFHQAIEVTRRQSARSLELRAVMSLSRLWERQGKRAEARQVLAEIYDWFTEGFDTPDLREAKALLDELA